MTQPKQSGDPNRLELPGGGDWDEIAPITNTTPPDVLANELAEEKRINQETQLAKQVQAAVEKPTTNATAPKPYSKPTTKPMFPPRKPLPDGFFYSESEQNEPENTPNKPLSGTKKAWIGAGIIGLLAASGAAIFGGIKVGSGLGEDPVPTQPAGVESPSQPNIATENPNDPIVVPPKDSLDDKETAVPASNSPETTTKEASVLDIVALGEQHPNPLIVTRANGETIKLPRLPENTNDITEFGQAAFALFTGYMSTGDQVILDEFSTDPITQNGLRELRKEMILDPYVDGFGDRISTYLNWQFALDTNPEDPTVFSINTDDNDIGYKIRIDGGMIFRISDSPEWQNEWGPFRTEWPAYNLNEDFYILLRRDPSNSAATTEIIGGHYAFHIINR